MKTYSYIIISLFTFLLLGCSIAEDEPEWVRYQLQEKGGYTGLNWFDSENFSSLYTGDLSPLLNPEQYGLGEGEWYQIYTMAFPNSLTEVTYFFRKENEGQYSISLQTKFEGHIKDQMDLSELMTPSTVGEIDDFVMIHEGLIPDGSYQTDMLFEGEGYKWFTVSINAAGQIEIIKWEGNWGAPD